MLHGIIPKKSPKNETKNFHRISPFQVTKDPKMVPTSKNLIDQVTVAAEVLVMLVRVVVGAWRPRIFGRGWVSGIIATILDR